MVGESFGIYSPQLAKNAIKLSTIVGENFVIYSSRLQGGSPESGYYVMLGVGGRPPIALAFFLSTRVL
jgi:hypothetical protein